MVESEFRFLEIEIKSVSADAIVFTHLAFHITPETFNPIDVIVAFGEFLAVINAVMFVSGIDQAVIATPFVSIDI